jgi:hypothetical protein
MSSGKEYFARLEKPFMKNNTGENATGKLEMQKLDSLIKHESIII